VQHFVKETIARLAQAQVEFVVVGGISAVLQGVPLVTKDLDICYRRTPANLTRLAAALAPLRPRLRGFPPDLPAPFDERSLQQGTNFTLLIGDEELDLLAEMSAIGGYDQVIGRATEMPVAGVQVKVLSLSQLIATKEAAGRPKDLAVLPLIKATLAFEQKQDQPRDEPPAGS
jgi:hypothetical protein